MNQPTIFDIIRSGDYLVLDTETTGLHSGSEICQIAIINAQGETLLDTLVKPVHPIPAEATAIHGITNEMVKDASLFPIYDVITTLLHRNVIIYNRDYDVRLLDQSTKLIWSNIPSVYEWSKIANWYCAMETFARIYGDWNPKFKSFRWQKLQTACDYYKIHTLGAHSALADCMATLAVCKAMVIEDDNHDQTGEDW